MSYQGLSGFNEIFVEGSTNYKKHGHKFENFRDTANNPMIYSFCINGGTIDNESLNHAKTINNKLYEKFINRKKKGLTGYKGIEDKYEEFDDHDSKHILILTILFNNNINFKNIVEIGGGYGNCVRIANNIIEYNKWKIVDLPYMIEFQHYFLKNEIDDISKIEFIDGTNNNYEFKKNDIDVVIATHSLSELSWENFDNYMKNVVSKSKYLFLGYNKNCPSPFLINKKLKYIQENNYSKVNNFDYTEKHGAHVSYTLFINNNLSN